MANYYWLQNKEESLQKKELKEDNTLGSMIAEIKN